MSGPYSLPALRPVQLMAGRGLQDIDGKASNESANEPRPEKYYT